ncbi:hypothetical protein SARC_01397 [Sphaeroforma arctica JP610]|uniref:Uncharacterized protein n=1 Tax=Sphaeroforma arctica JP610 TaxID=667725 RepID=A0A0L0GC18_9EUKA|nr:hypothetical protein SARC_01397 [Sphaeroforma arctica JP610]KNC86441.1 hypothetical protein SARC_01397 [Sphaeroforma arctica JP610]|eukprot:XP_014160343.1 hypothetical protein SARC_01397 [Sphaeroforma arctica JP610]
MESKTEMSAADDNDIYDDDGISTGGEAPPFRNNGRYCWGGMTKCAFIGLCVFIGFAVFIAIMVPVIFISVGASMAQSTTDNTVITITNSSLTYWGQNYKTSCSPKGDCGARLAEDDEGNSTCNIIATPVCNAVPTTIPNLMVLNQTLKFSNVAIPGVLQAGRYDMLYTNENTGDPDNYPSSDGLILIGDLYVPELDLHGLENNEVTIPDVEVILRVRNPEFFSSMSALASAPGMKGIWNQQAGSAIVEANILGTKMYYKASMASWIYNKNLNQCDGPMALLPPFSSKCPCKNDCIDMAAGH